MTEQTITFDCAECGYETTIQRDEIDEYEDDGKLVCGECGMTPWERQDFPLWIEFESYNDHYELGSCVERQTGLDTDDIPIARDLKYAVFSVYYKITENGVEGPYREKGGEKL
jgi:transcription elongation factor Elf1